MTSNIRSGWWAIDFAAYLLSPIEHLGGVLPSSFRDSAKREQAEDWIRQTELDWAPGTAAIPWDHLRTLRDDTALVMFVLEQAKAELSSYGINSGSRIEGSVGLSLLARRRLPWSTLSAYCGVALSNGRLRQVCDKMADGHVHQGGALPLEVTLHWLASKLTSIDRTPTRDTRRLKDAFGQRFWPAPLLLLLRAVIDRHERWQDAISCAMGAAMGSAENWQELNALLGYESPNASAPIPSLESIHEMKTRRGWNDNRRIALLRLEAVFHCAITQRTPGLDVFVSLFEDLATLRRALPKEQYLERAIEMQSDNSPLEALELRLGQLVVPIRDESENNSVGRILEEEYRKALSGYWNCLYASGKAPPDKPLRVAFPLGLIKADATVVAAEPPEHWRYDPSGIYELVESLIGLLDGHEELWPFVDGLDVCGYELDIPNWLFTPALERFGWWAARRTPTVTIHRTRTGPHEDKRQVVGPATIRFHAGEWFWNPVHGLRRIAEFLAVKLPSGTPVRIGHGLALHSDNWNHIGAEPADEMLDDLVWAYSQLHAHAVNDNLCRRLNRLALDLCPIVYPKVRRKFGAVSMETLIDAYEARASRNHLADIGFIQREEGITSPGKELHFGGLEPCPDGEADHVMVEHLSVRSEALPTVSVLSERSRSGRRVSSVDENQVKSALVAAYQSLKEIVRNELVARAVVVETCPTSNVLIAGLQGYEDHPIKELLRHGVRVTVNTDDPALFNSWLGDELEQLLGVGAISDGNLRLSQRLASDLIAPALQTDLVRQQLEDARNSLGVSPGER